MLIMIAVLFSCIPFITALWVLTAFMFMLGIIGSTVDVGCNTFIVWVHREKVAPYMNGLHFFFGVGGFLAPLLLAQVLRHTSQISWCFWVISFLILPVAFWISFQPVPNTPKSIHSDDKPKNSTDIKLFSFVIVFLSLFVGVEISFGGWIYSYGLATGLTDKMGSAYLTSVFWGAFTLARLISIPLAIHLKPISMLTICCIGSFVSFVLILLFPESLNFLILGSAGVGIFIASAFPTTLSFCERRLGITGKITSLLFVGASIGAIILPWVFGQLLEQQGPYALMVAMALTIATAFICLSVVYIGFIRNNNM